MKKSVTYEEELYIPVSEKSTPESMGMHITRIGRQMDSLYRQSGHPHLKLVAEPVLDCKKVPGPPRTIEHPEKGKLRVRVYVVSATYGEDPFDYRSPEEIQQQEQAQREQNEQESAEQPAPAKKTRKRVSKKAAPRKATKKTPAKKPGGRRRLHAVE